MPASEVVVNKVIVHPLVLLSVVDHFNRMGKIGNQKRVVGVLLGCWRAKGILDISNSFAGTINSIFSLFVYIYNLFCCCFLVPFDEDDKDKSVWFLDHDYLENMYGMFKKVNAKERVVGWYHTGPKLHQNDIAINELIRRYCPNSVLVIIDAKPKDLGLPTEAYIAVEEVHDDGSPTCKTFEHVPSEIGAEEAEEVGVEHLLRDIKDTTVGSLSQKITNQLMGLRGLKAQLSDIKNYLQRVGDGKMPINYQIVYQLQDIFNLLPDITNDQFTETMYVKTNDQMLVVYLASMVRSIIALHNLINNKLANRDAEEGKDKKSEDKSKESKDKENKETKDKKGAAEEKTDKSKDDTNTKNSKK